MNNVKVTILFNDDTYETIFAIKLDINNEIISINSSCGFRNIDRKNIKEMTISMNNPQNL